MSDQTKFAVIGAGHIGKRHAAMIQNNPQATLVGMADTNTALEKEISETFQVPFYSSAEELYKHTEDIHVVNVCTPNYLHAPQSIEALEKGYHVVCEKPMALSKTDCERVIYKALQKHKLLFCVMQNRYSPPSVWLKNLIDERRLGKIHMVQVNCYWNRDERYYRPGGKPHPWKGIMAYDGGTLFTQFSHFVDIMYWLFGDIKNIKAAFHNFKHPYLDKGFEDTGNVFFDFVNEGSGVLNYSTAIYDSNLESSITIIGEHGSVKVGGQYMNKIEYCNIKDYEAPELPKSNPPNNYGSYIGSAANHHYIIDNVVNTLEHKTSVTTNALEGLKVVEMIERIYQHKNAESV